MCHAGAEPRPFHVPAPARRIAWRRFINTATEPPDDIYPNLDGPPPPPDGVVTLQARSLVCYVAADQ